VRGASGVYSYIIQGGKPPKIGGRKCLLSDPKIIEKRPFFDYKKNT
jgi:hypothetical protein